MKNRLSAECAIALGAFATGLLGAGRAEEVYPQSRSESFELCQRGPEGGGCARFQGYIYVGRGSASEAASRLAPAGDLSLSGRRLYVHTSGAENR